jgi:hypothetical protein
MKRARRPITIAALLAILLCSTFSTGCNPLGWFGSNFTLTLYIPLGLDGTPGILNPFGIFQALVDQWTTPAQGTTGVAAADQSPTAAALTPTAVNPNPAAVLN